MKIKIDRTLCIGAGACTMLAPNTFELDSELKAVLKKSGEDSEENIIAAAKSCPVAAIVLGDDNNKQIFP